jgi:hypothetical protein
MKRSMGRRAETFSSAALAVLALCSTCWAAPPGPPSIPSTPVGRAEVSAATIVALAAYGYWKGRK